MGSRFAGGVDKSPSAHAMGWQGGHQKENMSKEGGFRRDDQLRWDNRGGFGAGGHFWGDQHRSASRREDTGGSGKGEDLKKGWGDVGPNTGVLRSEDKGTCFRCLQTGHHQARCSNPPVCYKCKKTCHMTSGCPEERKNHSLKLFGFGIPGQGLYSLQVPGLKLVEQ